MSKENDLLRLHGLVVVHEEQQTQESREARDELYKHCVITYGEQEARRMLTAGKNYYARHYKPKGDSAL